MKRLGICLTGFMLLATTAAAQDSNYWNNQYGTKAELLGGLVVGSASDISAAYYNPAWLAVGTDASLLLTTRALEYGTLEIKNAVGSGENPKHTSFRPSPGFLGGQFGKGEGRTWNVTWVYVEKMNFKFDGSARLVDENPTPPPGGNFWYSGEAFRVTDTQETWYGASFSRMIGERTSFGVTPFVAYRSQNQRIQAMVQALDASNTYADYYLVSEMGYSHFRALAKLGVAFDYRPVSFGLALTTPSLGITGSGDVYANNSYSGVDVGGVLDPYLAVTNQEGIDARWKSPPALAAGASWYLGGTRLHATAEWFGAVKGYDAISSEPFRSQSTGETLYPNHRTQSRSLVNFGVAADHRFTDVVSAFVGFRSDFTTQSERKPSNVLMCNWDLWHLSGGASFQFLGIELTMGMEYTFGDGTTYQVVDFSDGQGPDPAGDELAADVQYNRIKLLVGLDLAVLVGGN